MEEEEEEGTNTRLVLVIVIASFCFIILWVCIIFYRYRSQTYRENQLLRSTLENVGAANGRISSSQRREEGTQRIVLARKYPIEDVFPAKPLKEICAVFIRLRQHKNFSRECSICIEVLEDDSICRLLSCFHLFHASCIDEWMRKQCVCPLCKRNFMNSCQINFEESNFLNTVEVDYDFFLSGEHVVRRR